MTWQANYYNILGPQYVIRVIMYQSIKIFHFCYCAWNPQLSLFVTLTGWHMEITKGVILKRKEKHEIFCSYFYCNWCCEIALGTLNMNFFQYYNNYITMGHTEMEILISTKAYCILLLEYVLIEWREIR